jgi:predicted alpha/beta-hydrolase family hydrolase
MRLLEMLTVYPSDRAATAVLILAHGAGGGQTSRFMVEAATALAARGVATVTFDFPYVIAGRSVPDKAPVLEAAWRDAIVETRAHAELAALPLFIGGKSMGGRIASHIVAQGAVQGGAAAVENVRGVIFFGYPLHPPGKPEQRRDAHLPSVRQPMLFVQGSRDQFGTAAEIRGLLPRLNRETTLHEIADGDHSFKVRVKIAGRSQAAVHQDVFDTAAAFIARWSGRPAGAPVP